MGTGSKLSTTFFLGMRNQPNLHLRRPVRDVILAKPAAHVRDPAAPPTGGCWSARHGAWEVCKVSHTNATTGEIFDILRYFAPHKEADHGKAAAVSAVSAVPETGEVDGSAEAVIGPATSYERKIMKLVGAGAMLAVLLT